MQIGKTPLAVAAAGLLGAGVVLGVTVPDRAAHAMSSTPTTLTTDIGSDKSPIPLTTAPNYRAIVEQNASAVVGITIVGEKKVSQRGMQNPFGEDSPLAPFFRGMPQQQGSVPIHGLGSGFIVSEDGLILTNAHVVDGADKVTVKLVDGAEYEAKVLGKDTQTDVAVIRIEAKDLPTVRIGDPESLGVGDYVLAIGAPYGLEQSATAGIVSAKARSLPNDQFVPFIQTDVAVNPGNSGGPLFDSSGAVVGINSQIYSNSGGYEGVSFAIPIDVAMHIGDQLATNGSVQHALLGVRIQGVDQSLANAFDLERPGGALVARVEPDSAADKAGVKEGDVILSYDGKPLRDAGDLSARVGMAAPGDTVKLEVWRDGKKKTLKAELGASDTGMVADAGDGAGDAKLGLAVRPLSSDERRQAGLDEGVLVQDVDGPAAQAGIRPGDVVISVDGKAVSSADEIRQVIADHGDKVALLIQRGDMRIFVPVDLG